MFVGLVLLFVLAPAGTVATPNVVEGALHFRDGTSPTAPGPSVGLLSGTTLGEASGYLPAVDVSEPTPDSSTLLLTNARLVDPETQTVQQGALRIEGENISAVLDDTPPDVNGRTVDLEGMWVLPGLVDAHVHSWGNTGPAFQERQLLQTSGTARVMLYSGVTAFLDLFSPENYIFELRDRQHTWDDPGADIYAAGPILTCPDGHGTEYGIQTRTVASPADARQAVEALSARAPNVVKLAYHPYRTERYPSMDRPTMRAIIDAAQRNNLPTVVHVESWRGAHETIAAGADAITHTPPAPLSDSTLAAMKDRGTAWIPTLGVHSELAHWTQHPNQLDSALLHAVTDSSVRAAYRDTSRFSSEIRSWIGGQSRHLDTRLNAVAKGAEAGISILAGTDAGNPGLFQGYSLHRELVRLTQAGLSNWEALAAATTAPGQLLDAPFGLAPGDRANLLVVGASPLDDIRHTQEIQRVIYRGRLVDRETVHDAIHSNTTGLPTR